MWRQRRLRPEHRLQRITLRMRHGLRRNGRAAKAPTSAQIFSLMVDADGIGDTQPSQRRAQYGMNGRGQKPWCEFTVRTCPRRTRLELDVARRMGDDDGLRAFMTAASSLRIGAPLFQAVLISDSRSVLGSINLLGRTIYPRLPIEADCNLSLCARLLGELPSDFCFAVSGAHDFADPGSRRRAVTSIISSMHRSLHFGCDACARHKRDTIWIRPGRGATALPRSEPCVLPALRKRDLCPADRIRRFACSTKRRESDAIATLQTPQARFRQIEFPPALLRDFSMVLKHKNMSPHSLYLLYRSLFETLRPAPQLAPVPMKHLFIKTYGCQMNVYDSARMADLLAPLGYAAERTRPTAPTWSSSTPVTSARRRRRRSIPISAGCARSRTARSGSGRAHADRGGGLRGPGRRRGDHRARSPPSTWWSGRNPIIACPR